MNMTADLAYWITERYAMKSRKDAGVPPLMAYGWSADPHMGTVRYCNVHREDDKVTQWLAQHWRPNHHKAWEIVLARMVNYIPSLEMLIDWLNSGYSIEEISRLLKIYREGDHLGARKVFTSAYTISTCGQRMDKIDYVMGVVEEVKYIDNGTLPYTVCNTCEVMYEWLQTVKGLGSFLAAQVVADLKNTAGHPLAEADDFWTFSAHGPGSLRGLGWYFNREPNGVTPATYHAALRVCRSEVDPLIDGHIPRISNQDFQNCLCELSKYCKVKYLHGHVRNRYGLL